MGKMPSIWALALIALLPVIRFILNAILGRSGHGELLILAGMFMGLVVGAAAFEMVGMKPDLGALIIGILLADHPKAKELSESLMGFKDIFLVGFFLTIGLSGVPTFEALGIAILLTLVMPLKVVLFFFLLTRFKLRVRTSLLTSLSLANYSEFGLIVSFVGARNGWISNEWLVVIALALSITFVIAAPLNTAAHRIYMRVAARLKSFETKTRLPEEEHIDAGDARVVIFGMGRIGTGAYDFLRKRHGEKVIGFDYNPDVVRQHQEAGRNVIKGDPMDLDFWERVQRKDHQVNLVMLAMTSATENIEVAKDHQVNLVMLAMTSATENIEVAKFLNSAADYQGMIAATARFDDEVEALKEAGVDAAFNVYGEAGAGFAGHICTNLDGACNLIEE
jgi:hypothetical protein